MYRKLIVTATVAAALALSACSSSDDDEGDEATPSGENTPSGEGGEGETSMPAPGSEDEPFVVDGEPSGNDTSAIAGLWISSEPSEEVEGEIDRSFVEISDDGLYTDYDDQADPDGSGENCYVITPRRLDLETGEATDGEYSASGLPSFTLVASADGSALVITERGEEGELGEPVVWEAASEETVVENFVACDG